VLSSSLIPKTGMWPLNLNHRGYAFGMNVMPLCWVEEAPLSFAAVATCLSLTLYMSSTPPPTLAVSQVSPWVRRAPSSCVAPPPTSWMRRRGHSMTHCVCCKRLSG
jgi:hypothetical protein